MGLPQQAGGGFSRGTATDFLQSVHWYCACWFACFSWVVAMFLPPSQCLRLKNCTSRSCCCALARESKVPRFLCFPVFGLIFLEYSRYCPDLSFRIMMLSSSQKQIFAINMPRF